MDRDRENTGARRFLVPRSLFHRGQGTAQATNPVHRFAKPHKNVRNSSLIRIGGNGIVWRSELKSTVDGVTGVLEIKKWPMEFQMRGAWDGWSLMADPTDPLDPREKTGGWRFLEVIAGTSRDFILGTLPDMAGFRDPDPPPGKRAPEDQFGRWAVQTSTHAFWGPSAIPIDTLLGSNTFTGRVVGGEADRFFDNQETDGGGPLYPSVPDFLYGMSGSLPTVLAYGTELDPIGPGDPDDGLKAVKLQWDATEWTKLESELDLLAQDIIPGPGGNNPFQAIAEDEDVNGEFPPNAYLPYGQILTYWHQAGGRVLSISSISAPRALLDSDLRLSELVERALECMLFNTGCP